MLSSTGNNLKLVYIFLITFKVKQRFSCTITGDNKKFVIVEQEHLDVKNFSLHTQDHLNYPDTEGRVYCFIVVL